MKLFFISDIHGNQFALERVLAHAKALNSDAIFCAGDISGYFTGINEVINILKTYDVKCIMGNHDAFLLERLPINAAKSYYASYLKTKEVISEASYKWLKNLPVSASFDVGNISIRLYHGGPVNELNEYIYPDNLSSVAGVLKGADIFVFGHTHLQFGVKTGDKIFLNPGSVGLPRNGDFRVHGISYDTGTGIFAAHRLAYNLVEMIKYYEQDDSINPLYFHNICFGRSSKRVLKSHHRGFLTAKQVSLLQADNIKVINTKFGAALCSEEFSSTNNAIYVASYLDGGIELTTTALQFNWQHHLPPLKKPGKLIAGHFVNDQAGTSYNIQYKNSKEFNRTMVTDIEFVLQLIKNYKIKNVEI